VLTVCTEFLSSIPDVCFAILLMFWRFSLRLLSERIVQQVYRQRLPAFDRDKLYKLETGRTVTSFLCFVVRSISTSCRHFVSGNVIASTSFHLTGNSMAGCPGNRMHWDITPDFIANESDKLISESKAVYDTVGALDSSAVNYDNVIKVFLHLLLLLLLLDNKCFVDVLLK